MALKFQEMEEKMRKEKKGKGNSTEENEKEELQSIEVEDASKPPEVLEEPTGNAQRETLDTIEDDNDKK